MVTVAVAVTVAVTVAVAVAVTVAEKATATATVTMMVMLMALAMACEGYKQSTYTAGTGMIELQLTMRWPGRCKVAQVMKRLTQQMTVLGMHAAGQFEQLT